MYEGHGTVAEIARGVAQKIVKTNEFLAHPMGMEEAIMQMDLMNNDFYVFTNSHHDGDERRLPPQGRHHRPHRGLRGGEAFAGRLKVSQP